MTRQDETLQLSGIIRESIVDGPGIRFVVFCQGCPHHCAGCHNPATHPFEGGKEVSVQRLMNEIEKNPLLKGVTFSGGEPTCQTKGFLALATAIEESQINLDIVMFSGYTYEELTQMRLTDCDLDMLLKKIHILIDGPYMENKRDLTLQYRGSSNQRVIDLRKTEAEGSIILYM